MVFVLSGLILTNKLTAALEQKTSVPLEVSGEKPFFIYFYPHGKKHDLDWAGSYEYGQPKVQGQARLELSLCPDCSLLTIYR